ncbi:PI-PLC X domain-containing protein 1-like isoform X2 [Conger conger]|nr:PI-PLC X domain-containing protein 1-like isoform X2 [Conger conger]
MTYCLDLSSPLQESMPHALKVLDRIIPCIIRPCLSKWSTTQVQKISAQLDIGIRYFDLRIAHKEHDTTKALYCAHGVYTLLTVKDALKDIAEWLTSHPKEVLLLACSTFEGMNTVLHQDLILFLKSLFGSKIFPRTCEKPATLATFWKLGHQVIISYDHSAASGHEELWPKIPYWWANQIDPSGVLSYLKEQQKGGRPDGFFVAGLNLTEDTKYILTHPCQSIKSLTLQSSPQFLDWVKEQSPGPGSACLNIICGDFVGNSDLVSIVIDLNNKLAERLTS